LVAKQGQQQQHVWVALRVLLGTGLAAQNQQGAAHAQAADGLH
jgi:hypothetical protein